MTAPGTATGVRTPTLPVVCSVVRSQSLSPALSRHSATAKREILFWRPERRFGTRKLCQRTRKVSRTCPARSISEIDIVEDRHTQDYEKKRAELTERPTCEDVELVEEPVPTGPNVVGENRWRARSATRR
jgi:hypothetical protein